MLTSKHIDSLYHLALVNKADFPLKARLFVGAVEYIITLNADGSYTYDKPGDDQG